MRTFMRGSAAGALLACVVFASACASARADTTAAGPPLAMPEPPPRVFGPLAEQPLAAERAVAETPTSGAPVVAREPVPEPEPEPVRTPEPEAPIPEPQQPAPQRELRATSTLEGEEATQLIRSRLSIARQQLADIDSGGLSPAGREQYVQAETFIGQAEDALQQRNFVFAQTLAEKAAQLADELAGT